MKNKVIRGVLAAACVTTAVSAANVFGAGTEQSLVNEASAVTQEETEETSEAETTDENTPEMTETETPDSTAENAASDLPAAEVQSGNPEETAVSVQAGSYYPWVNENGIWYFKDPDGTIVKGAWREYDKNRYYLNNDGKMAVGWKKLDGAWYYFQSWGGVYRDAFYTVKNVPYYSDADGKMATGWKLIDDVYYYFDAFGVTVSRKAQCHNICLWQKFRQCFHRVLCIHIFRLRFPALSDTCHMRAQCFHFSCKCRSDISKTDHQDRKKISPGPSASGKYTKTKDCFSVRKDTGYFCLDGQSRYFSVRLLSCSG